MVKKATPEVRTNTPQYIMVPPANAETNSPAFHRVKGTSIRASAQRIAHTPVTGRIRRCRWKREAATCINSDRGRSSTRSKSPERSICQGKKSKPRHKLSASPKEDTARA
ncbi:hypothetical protein D3C75_996510 [compost metagenome]